SVALAVRQANRQHTVRGWRIALDAEDDQALPDVGAIAATRLADERSVMAVVGPVNSAVAEQAAPILDSRKVVLISPANTDPALTRGPDPRAPQRPHQWYFRVAATFAYQTAGKRTVAVVHDRSADGQGLARQFRARFEKLGGTVPTVEGVDPGDQDFTAVLARIRRVNPDLVYFAGESPATAARLTTQADQRGVKVPLLG